MTPVSRSREILASSPPSDRDRLTKENFHVVDLDNTMLEGCTNAVCGSPSGEDEDVSNGLRQQASVQDLVVLDDPVVTQTIQGRSIAFGHGTAPYTVVGTGGVFQMSVRRRLDRSRSI